MSAFYLLSRMQRTQWGFHQISFMNGPVIVAGEVDASSRPFQLPTATGADKTDSALIVTGFIETEIEVQLQAQVQQLLLESDLR